MGKLHVAKTYKVEYSESNWFNHDLERINEFLYDLHYLVTQSVPEFNCDEYQYATRLEFNKTNWTKMIDWLKMKYQTEYAIMPSGGKEGYSNGEMVRFMQEILDKSDPNNDFLILEWF